MLKHHLNVVCEDIWNRLKNSQIYDINQGEETITDNILLYLAMHNLNQIKIIKTSKHKESKQGTDWEWWIGNHCKGWFRYAVQAKKLNIKENRYKSLLHKIGTPSNQTYQHDVIEKYANANNATPLYAFYNYIKKDDYLDFWNCCLTLDESKLGCTVTPLKNVKLAISSRGDKTFDNIHKFPETIPLRCLVTCPKVPTVYRDFKNTFDSISDLIDLNSIAKNEEFPVRLYNHEIAIYPRRILIIETE